MPDEQSPNTQSDPSDLSDVGAQQPAAPTPLRPDDVVFPRERRFQIGDREIVVRPLKMAAWKRLQDDLSALSRRLITEHPSLELSEPAQWIPIAILFAADSVMSILGHVLGMDPEELREALEPADVTAIALAILELNRLPEIVGNVRRARQVLANAMTVR